MKIDSLRDRCGGISDEEWGRLAQSLSRFPDSFSPERLHLVRYLALPQPRPAEAAFRTLQDAARGGAPAVLAAQSSSSGNSSISGADEPRGSPGQRTTSTAAKPKTTGLRSAFLTISAHVSAMRDGVSNPGVRPGQRLPPPSVSLAQVSGQAASSSSSIGGRGPKAGGPSVGAQSKTGSAGYKQDLAAVPHSDAVQKLRAMKTKSATSSC